MRYGHISIFGEKGLTKTHFISHIDCSESFARLRFPAFVAVVEIPLVA